MRLAEGLAARAFKEVAGDRFARREGERMDQAVQAVPMGFQLLKQSLYFRIAGHFAGQRDRGAELFRHVLGALTEALVLVGEGDLRAFAPRHLGDAVGDRAVGEEPGDEDALAREQSHRPIILSAP